jgi:hypothetical protein
LEIFFINANRRALVALNQGANALFYFNAFDDYEECSPHLLLWTFSYVYYHKKRYFATRQLYHFVRPGSRRVASSGLGQGLTVSAFKNPDGSWVIVGVKEGGSNRVQLVLKDSLSIPREMELYLTSPTVNCLKSGSIRVHNGVTELDLPDEAVFALVIINSRPASIWLNGFY